MPIMSPGWKDGNGRYVCSQPDKLQALNFLFNNHKNVKTMELKITKERILEAASKCSMAKATLQVLFPEVFDDSDKDHECFCYIGQILKRAGYHNEYAVVVQGKETLRLANLSNRSFWSTTNKTYAEVGYAPEDEGMVTRGVMKKLLRDVSFSIDEFSVK